MRKFLVLGSFCAALGVALGAFGAHALKSMLSPDMLAVFETAVRYQMYHSLALIGTGICMRAFMKHDSKTLRVAGWSFLTGIILFSGSLYLLTIFGLRWLGAITPFGGVAFIGGWIAFAWTFVQRAVSSHSVN